jgi:hypothetical protein
MESLVFGYYSRILRIVKDIIDDKQLTPEEKIRTLGTIL